MDLVSASQITLFRDCQRKWGWRYLAGIKTPQHPAAALGTECDDTQLQPYLRDGRAIDYTRESGYIVAPGLTYLPKPLSSDLEVQKHFTMPSPTWADGEHVGFGYQGYIDLWLPLGGMPDIDGDRPVVSDFKTTGNWKYAKNAAQLATDVQAQTYATWAMFSTGAREIDLVWIYFATKGPRKAKRVHLRVVADQVLEQFSKINDTAIEMFAIRQSVFDPLELAPTVSQCDAFGGCPYRSNCNLSPSQFLDLQAKEKAPMATTAELLARLKAQQVGINPPEKDLPPAPAVGQNEVAAAAPAPPPTNGAQAASDLVEAISNGTAFTPEPVATAKRGPGRPRKTDAPKDPLGADVAMHTETVPAAAAQSFGGGKLTVTIGSVVIEAMIREGERYTDTLQRLGVTL